MLIMGTKVKEKVLSQGQFFCPTCDVTRNYKLKQFSNYFTFFFIPVLANALNVRFAEMFLNPKS